MGGFSRAMVEKAGINADLLLGFLTGNARKELIILHCYASLAVALPDRESNRLRKIVGMAEIEDRVHFDRLLQRIHELGGQLTQEMKTIRNHSIAALAGLSARPGDTRGVLNMLVETEQGAVDDYAHICNLTVGRDPRTCELALAILNEEMEHESWFSGFLAEGPAAPILVREEISPYIARIPR